MVCVTLYTPCSKKRTLFWETALLMAFCTALVSSVEPSPVAPDERALMKSPLLRFSYPGFDLE